MLEKGQVQEKEKEKLCRNIRFYREKKKRKRNEKNREMKYNHLPRQ
jgi:hypothetical protein